MIARRFIIVTTMVGLASPATAATYRCDEEGGALCDALIPDGAGVIESTFEVPASVCGAGETIACVEVQLAAGHMEPSDLVIYLVHPDGTDVLLFAPNVCVGRDDLDTRFADRATAGYGPFMLSAGALEALDGKPPAGTWTLRVSDTEYGSYGALSSWGLEINCVEDLPDGAVCESHKVCASGYCIDGVCCESGCGGGADDCVACAIAAGGSADGTCAHLGAGTSLDGLAAGDACDGPDSDACVTGTLACTGGVAICEGETSVTETCDGTDEDCDGATDEDFAVGTACDGPDADACANGLIVCDGAGGARCDTESIVDIVETCNGQDDDCDGTTDDGFPLLGSRCDGPDDDRCPGGVVVCSGDGAGTTCGPEDPELSAASCDEDGDSIPDVSDNCVDVPNFDQADLDRDGIGNACDDSLDGARVHGSSACAGGGDAPWTLAAFVVLAFARARRRRVALVSLYMIVLAVGAGGHARAEGELDVRMHQPVPGGDANLVSLHGAEVLQHLRASAGLYLDYARDPLVLTIERPGDDADIALLANELRVDVLAAVGFFKVLELGLALPLSLARADAASADLVGSRVAGSAVGDLRVVPKWRIARDVGPLSLALAVPITVPTSGGEYLAGSDGLTFEPRLILGLDLGRVRVVTNIGYVIQDAVTLLDLEVGGALRWGVGAEVRVVPEVSVFTEVLGEAGGGEGATDPLEAGLGARVWLAAGHAVTLGGAIGLSEGYGTPAWHAYLGYTFTQAPPGDADKDGVIDPEDRCVLEAEDQDGFQDDDGCPELDNDGDGIPDADDGAADASGLGRCRDKAEDMDGTDDDDGCPDVDDDGDGVPDIADGPKDASGFGSCRAIPEDKDGFQDDDGCPDPDNDGDGFPDVDDGPKDASGFGRCRDKAETMNGFEDDDGCPDVKRAEISDKQIDLYETVQFATGEALLLPESYELLDQIAKILADHPEVTKVEVAGHTDDVADDTFNQKLSEQRAQAVADYLVNKGVAKARLAPKGYGESQPLERATTPEARQKNRRVEFRILQRQGGTK